jgi:hypothetical protein
MRHFDAIIIGMGQAGPPLAAIFPRGKDRNNYRTSQVRRHLCEYWTTHSKIAKRAILEWGTLGKGTLLSGFSFRFRYHK